jgi:hypothetical protein
MFELASSHSSEGPGHQVRPKRNKIFFFGKSLPVLAPIAGNQP